MFPVDILWRPSTGGPISARSFNDIYDQLAQVMDQPRAGKQNDPSAICSLSAQDRKAWAATRDEILEKGGDAAASLGLMESAVLTLCLEENDAPSELADILNAVRLGGGGDSQTCLRYYDKVLDRIWIRVLNQDVSRFLTSYMLSSQAYSLILDMCKKYIKIIKEFYKSESKN